MPEGNHSASACADTQPGKSEGNARLPTPGPWEWVRDDEFGMHTLSPGILIIDHPGGGGPWGDEIDRANARLIASAPDLAGTGAFLLERLADFEREMESESGDAAVRDWHGHVAPAVARFRAAIAKANPLSDKLGGA